MSELQITQVAVSFGAASVIRDATLTVKSGEVVGLIGRNGAGKTTLLRAISGLVARKGNITLDGVELAGKPESVARKGIIHVPEGRQLFPNLTVQENVEIGAIGGGCGEVRPAVDAAIAEFPQLEPLRQQRAGTLSGGEQQMVALARGLAARPRFLLIDEMSLGLSPKAVHSAMRRIAEIAHREGVGALLVDQSARLLRRYCDRQLLLRDGRVQQWDAEAELSQAYFD